MKYKLVQSKLVTGHHGCLAWLFHKQNYCKTCCKSSVSQNKAYDVFFEYERGALGRVRVARNCGKQHFRRRVLLAAVQVTQIAFPYCSVPLFPLLLLLLLAASSRPTLATSTGPGGCPGL